MFIGVDFDNTIVSYDQLFHRLAVQRDLIPEDFPQSKQTIRDHLREHEQEREWTALQGLAYGSRIEEATAFPGVLDFFNQWRLQGCTIAVISHRTQTPIQGGPFDLHRAARIWLINNGLIPDEGEGLYLETTRQGKLQKIADLGCEAFIDDLPEMLTDANFPAGVQRVLFDPHHICADHPSYTRAHKWSEMSKLLQRGPDGG